MSLHPFGFCALNDQGHNVCPATYTHNGVTHVCACENHGDTDA